MADPQLRPILAALHSDGRLRIWSIVITIFGDLVQPRGGSIAMGDLIALTAPLGIEEGALRTAMSRLAKDGWVEGTRSGRQSHYALTAQGRAEFVPAAARIYRPPGEEEPERWTLLMAAPGAPAPEGLTLAPGLVLRPGGSPVPDGTLAVSGLVTAVPDWARAGLAAPEARAGLEEILTLFAPLDPVQLGQEDAMTARLLLIHFWRRHVLRHAPLPRAFQPADWPGPAAHALVAGLYHKLWPLSEPDASDAAKTQLAARF